MREFRAERPEVGLIRIPAEEGKYHLLYIDPKGAMTFHLVGEIGRSMSPESILRKIRKYQDRQSAKTDYDRGRDDELKLVIEWLGQAGTDQLLVERLGSLSHRSI